MMKRVLGRKATARLLSFLLMFSLLSCQLPVNALAADETGVAEIATAEGFASMSADGVYKLTQDITITAPYASEFSGTFDGNGHTVTLDINGSTYQGLFSKLFGGAVVKNVITAGSVTGTNYVGGIAGQVNSYAGPISIENCKNGAGIVGEGKVGGIAGYASSSNVITISGCANTGAITGSGNQVGGVVGNIEGAAHVLTNCYNLGDISGFNQYAGLAGRGSDSVQVENCYTVGSVAAYGTSIQPGFALVGGSGSAGCSVKNCYALTGVADVLVYTNYVTTEDCQFKTADEMKAVDFATTLGGGFRAKTGEYPVLAWEIPTASVPFTITPANAVLTINGASYTGSTAVALPAGTYTYDISCEGYTAETGSITITTGQADSGEVLPEINVGLVRDQSLWSQVSFSLTPVDASVTVMDGEFIVEPQLANSYQLLKNHAYTYTVSTTEAGYEDAAGTLNISGDTHTETVSLKQVAGIALGGNYKTEYYQGDVLDTTGMMVTVTYTDGTTAGISAGDFAARGVAITGFDASQVVEAQTLTVSYRNASATYSVQVREKPFPSTVFNALAGYATVEYSHTGSSYTSGDGNEFVDDENEGALKSNSAGMPSTTVTVTITFNEAMPAAEFSFDYKVSSEEGSYSVYDGIQINGGSKIGGQQAAYTTYTATVNGGDTFTIAYTKDSSTDIGDDCVYLKGFSLSPLYTVTFTATPNDATVELKQGDTVITGGDGVYTVKPGEYTYTASRFGYEPQTGSITVGSENVSLDITLTQLASNVVTFAVTLPDGVTGPYTVEVKYGDETVYTGDGTGCSLPAGTYTYIISHEKCEGFTGVLAVDGVEAVSATLTRKLVFSDFFDGVDGITAADDTAYPFLAVRDDDGDYLQSYGVANYGEASITLTAAKNIKLSFDYWGSNYSYSSYPFTVKKGPTTLMASYGKSEWASFSTTLLEGEQLTLTYEQPYTYSSSSNSYCVKLKNFAAVPIYTVSFTLDADDASAAALTLADSTGSTVVPDSGTAYMLTDGTYGYTVSRFGYQTVTGSVTVSGGDQAVTVPALTQLSSHKASFTTDPENATVTVTHAAAGTMAPEGGVYTLPEGETYSYTVAAEGYITVSGSFTLDEDRAIAVTLTYAGDAWDGTATAEPQQAEDGTYLIGNAAELAWFANAVNGGQTTINGKLTANINLNGQSWTAFGTYDYSATTSGYAGTLDGGGFTVSGLAGGSGLVNCLDLAGTIKNVRVNGTLSGSGNIGGIVNTSYGTVENCQFSGSISNSSSYGSTGGIVGRALGAGNTVRGCVNTGAIQNTTSTYNSTLNIGGIVGYTYGTVENCVNSGAVSADTSRTTNSAIGGIAGQVYAGAQLKNLCNIAPVTGPAAGIGAVIGTNAGTVENSYYLAGTSANGVASNQGTTAPAVTGVPAEEMKTDLFAYNLGEAFRVDSTGLNGGFPVLYWQGGREPQISTDEELVAKDMAALALKDSDGNGLSADSEGLYQIKTALTLALPASGENGSTITWTCAPDGQGNLDLATGALVLPGQDKIQLTLTAAITKGTVSETRSFTLVLWSADVQDMELLNGIKAGLETTGTFIQPLQAYGHTNIAQAMEQYLMRQGYTVDMSQYNYDDDNGGIRVSFVNPGEKYLPVGDTEYLDQDGNITYYTAPAGYNGMNYAIYQNVGFRLALNGSAVNVAALVHIGWDEGFIQDRLNAAVESITWDSIRGENTNAAVTEKESPADWWDTVTVDGEVSGSLILPYRLADYGDVTVKWTSADTDALYLEDNSDGTYTAILNRPPYGGDALTFSLIAMTTFNRLDDYTIQEAAVQGEEQDWYTGVRKFVITIAPNDTDQSDAIKAALQDYPTLLRDFVNKDQPVDTSNITDDLQMPTSLTLEDAGIMTDRYNQKVTMVSGNTEVLDFNGYHAQIYRPLPGEEATQVNYTITISDRRNGATLGQQTFSLTVPALAQDDIDAAASVMQKACTTDAYWNGIRAENTDKENVTSDLESFAEILIGEDGALEYVRGAINLTFGGVEVDDLPGYDPMGSQPWREFRSSRPTVIACETLALTRPEYDTQVTLDSVFTHSTFGKYWEKFGSDPRYAQFEQFYKQPVSVTVTAKGTAGTTNPNPSTSLSATVSIDGDGFENFFNTSGYTFRGDADRDWTAWDALEACFNANGYSYAGSGSYISAVTDRNGVELKELEHGENSGWMYYINGELPELSLNQAYLKNGDTVKFFYTGDYQTVPGTHGYNTADSAVKDVEALISAIGTVGNESGPAIAAAREAYDGLADSQKAQVSNYGILLAAEEAYAALNAGLPFTDVSASAYYYDAVLWAVEEEITTGTTPATFSPDASCTRAQMVAFLWRAAGSPEATATANPFADVSAGAYYYDAVLWAVGQGITNGTTDTTFSPDVTVTRSQTVTLLYRYAGMPEITGSNAFNDVADEAYYANAVQWAVDSEVTNGTGSTTFSPDDDCTRAQIVTMLYRYMAG